MDKYEYKLKTGQMLELMEDGAFNKAAEIADSIDWKRVRNTKMLTDVSDIYEKNGDYQKSYEVLNIAYHRAEGSRKIVYRLCTLALKTKNVDEAIDYYDDFQQIAPKDPNKFILRYQILRAQRAPIEQQIEALEEFKKAEYIEEWAYELAKRYQEAGMTAECLEECDDLILWFNEGKYVYQAMELKMQYKPLTPSQQEKYDNRFARMSNETMEMPNIEEYSNEKSAASNGESVDSMLAEAEGISEEAAGESAQEPRIREVSGRKIGSTMKLDEALKSLLHLGMEEEDKVKDSSSEPVSTDVIFEEDKFKDAIEEIEAVADLDLIDEISSQKGLRELKVDPDLEELLPDPFPDDDKTLEELYSDVGTPLEELYVDAGASLEEPGMDTRQIGTSVGGDTKILDKETLQTIAALDMSGSEENPADAARAEAAGREDHPAEMTAEEGAPAAGNPEEERQEDAAAEGVNYGNIIPELNEEAREIIAELDEEARRAIEELDEEEEQPMEPHAAEHIKTASAEHRNQVEGQMNLLDLMADMDTEPEVTEEESADDPEFLMETDMETGEREAAEPVLPLDIQRMIDEIEGVIPAEEPEERDGKKVPEQAAETAEDEKPRENMGEIAEQLRVDESSEWFEDYDDVLDEEEYADELPEEELIEEPVEDLAEELEGPVEDLAEELGGPVEDLAEELGGPVEDLTEELEESVEDLTEELEEPVEDLTEELEEPMEDLTEESEEVLADGLEGLVEDPTEEPDEEEFTEDIEISFGGEDEEEADEYDVEDEFGEIREEHAEGEHFTIEYQEEHEFGYEEENADAVEAPVTEGEPEYTGRYETEENEPEYEGYEDAEYEDEPEYEGYEDAEYEDELEYEGAGDAEYGNEPEYEGTEDAEYGEEPDYEGYEDAEYGNEPDYEGYEDTGYEEEPDYEGYEDAGYGEAADYAGDEDADYEDEPDYEGYEDAGYGEEPDYEGYEDAGYEGDPDYEGYEDAGYGDDPEYEDGEEAEYTGEYEEEEYEDGYEYEEEEYYTEDAYEDGEEDEYEEYDAADVEANLEHEFRPHKPSRRYRDEREVPDEEEEEMDILSATTPLSRKETAKLIATGKTAPLPMDEISDALSMSDTGFVVHGRYDLRTQSGIGTRAGLTEEQKKLFSYFVPVRGMSEQLVDVLEQDKNCTNRRGTSNTGNLLIIGNKGNGKTVLAVDVVKAIQKQRNIRQGRVAIVTGDSLNKKKISDIFSKLYGGALIIEKAGKMNEKTVARVNKAMERDTGELLIVLEDQRKPLDRLLTSNREFRRKFTSRLEVPILINDELVTFGQTYAQENGYQIDEMGILALYSRIDMLQREDHAVTIAEVKEVMDEAMEHSQKASAKKLVKRVLGKNRDDSDRIILTEKDFI